MYVDILETFLSSLRSVGTAGTMAAMGIYLQRNNLIVGEEKRKLALISKKVTLPAFLFTRIIYCKQDWSDRPCPNITDSLNDIWMLLLWPLYVVGCGLMVGYAISKFTGTPRRQQNSVMTTCAFANSTGLPITLLTVIHQSFPVTMELGRVDTTLFLSVYLLLYPVLQWGVGGYMISSSDDDNDADAEEQIILSDDIEKVLKENKVIDIFREKTCKVTDKITPSHSSTSTLDTEQPNVELTPLIKDMISYSQTTTTTSLSNSVSYTTTDSATIDCDNDINIIKPHDYHYHLEKIKNIAHKCLPPPVIGALLGMVVACIPALRGLFIDLAHRSDHAPLEWLFDGLYGVGQAAIPLNMMILGLNLSASFGKKTAANDDKKLLSMPTMVGIVIGKLVVMPIIGILSAVVLKNFILNIPEDIDAPFYLVAMIVFITPTANDVMVMVELSEGASKEGIARVFGLQYLCSPVLLSISVTAIVAIASKWS